MRDCRPAQLEVHVAPVLRILRLPFPLVGNADATREGYLPVHNQQLAVRAVVHACEVVPVQRAVAVHLDARLLHQVEQILFHFQAADPVQQHVHAHAGPGAFGQQFRHLAADIAGPVDIGFEVDGVPGSADRRQHGGEDFGTVLQITHLVARHDGRAQQYSHLAAELWIGDDVAMCQLAFQLLFGRGKVQRQYAGKQGQDNGDDDDPEHFAFFPHGEGLKGFATQCIPARQARLSENLPM